MRAFRDRRLLRLLAGDPPLSMKDDEGCALLQVFPLAGLQQPNAVDVRVARDGLAGVVAATAPDVAVVLMDLRLPGLDGLEAIRRIRAHHRGGGPAILAVTAHAMPDDEARCVAAGVDGYLAKPVRLRELRERIVALVAARGAGR